MMACFYALLALLIGTGAYITFSSSWSLLYKAALLVHPFIGVLVLIGMPLFLFLHYKNRAKEILPSKALWVMGVGFTGLTLVHPAALNKVQYPLLVALLLDLLFLSVYLKVFFKDLALIPLNAVKLSSVAGVFLTFLFAVLAVSGFFMWPGAAHNTRLILWHRYLGFLFAGFFLLHAGRYLISCGLPAVMRRFALPALVLALSVAALDVISVRRATVEVPVEFSRSLEGRPERLVADTSPAQLVKSCAGGVCHRGIVEHYLLSNHFQGPKTLHFQKIVTLLEKERGKESTRFCAACHAPHQAIAETLGDNDEGISCTGCHLISKAQLSAFGRKKGGPEGYTLTINRNHLEMFKKVNEKQKISGINAYLIRLNPLGHGRVFMSRFMKSDAFCLSCHQQHIPPKEKEAVVRPKCTFCHMELQKSFVKNKGVKKAHFFAGANVVTPHLLRNRKSYNVVRSWLTGSFTTKVLDSYWELRKKPDQPPSRAVWLVMTMEAVSPPVPGEICRIKIYTSNPGIGHPFPTGVIDLYDLWLEFKVYDEKGQIIYQDGKPNQRPFENTSTHLLGGYFYDAEGKPIFKHRIWEKKGAKYRWIEPGKTVEDLFVFEVPSDLKGQSFLTVKARWMYNRLNRDFTLWAYGRDLQIQPVSVVSIEQRVPLES